MNKSSHWKTNMTEEDKAAARKLADEESNRRGKKVSALEILEGVMTDAERNAPEPK